MGSKNNPGKFDCYAKAEPDEPLFVLMGRDPMGGHLASIWSKLRQGDAEAAQRVFNDLVSRSGRLGYPRAGTTDVEKAQEAMDCAFDMFAYAQGRGAQVRS